MRGCGARNRESGGSSGTDTEQDLKQVRSLLAMWRGTFPTAALRKEILASQRSNWETWGQRSGARRKRSRGRGVGNETGGGGQERHTGPLRPGKDLGFSSGEKRGATRSHEHRGVTSISKGCFTLNRPGH